MVGIHVAIPIFTGGYTTANVARAREVYRQRQHELAAAGEKALADATRQYTNVVDGAQRIRALQSAVASGELSVDAARKRSEEHTSELQSLMRISYAVFCLKKKKTTYRI